MKRSALVLLAATLVTLVAVAAACGGDSNGGLSVLDKSGASPTASASPSASATTSPAPITSPSEAPPSPTATDPGDAAGGSGSGDLSADEFSAYVDGVAPWYDEIIATEAKMIAVIEKVETNQISPGQGARRLEVLGYRLDPPVVELASMQVPPALEKAHTAWLDGISFEARGFARLVELMASGTYQRGSVDSQYDSLMTKASARWTAWQNVIQPYESELGVKVPWTWPNE